MDNHSFPDAIHVFIAQHPDNDTDTEDMPDLAPLDARGFQPQQQTTTDVEINGGSSAMLPLASFSNSSYEDHDNPDSESGRDAHEVEMQTLNIRSLSDHAVPNPSPTSHTSLDQPAVNNRRAREDDEDDDRDRRHPSQRIGNSANAASSAGRSSSTPPLSSQVPPPAPQAMPGGRLRGQAPIFTRTVVDEPVTVPRTHPFRFFQHLMSNNNNSNNNNDAGNVNPVPPLGGPVPVPPHQDGNTPDNQPHRRIETFSVTVDIGIGPAFTMGGGAQPHEGQANLNAADPNLNANPNDAQNPNMQGISIADFMARLGQAIGIGENGHEGTGAPAPTAGDNPAQGTGGAGATPGPQFGFNIPGGFNLANLAGLGFGFNFDGSGFGEKEDPERARKLVNGLEEVPVGLVRRLERIGGTGGGMGEDETKGGDGGCAICWDRLLGSDEEAVHQHQECEKKEEESERIQRETSMDEASDRTTPKIVSLPCAHVFHAECLIPWFSRPRQTTCPTCRFNIDPENLTYVSWRRRMRERRERERAEARARDPENADGNEAGQDGIVPPTAATAAEPAVAPLPETGLTHEQILSLLSRPLGTVRSQTPDASVPNVRPTPTPRSRSHPPASSSSTLTPSTSQPTSQTRTRSEEGVNDWIAMPQLQGNDEGDNDEEDEDDDEDEDEEDEEGEEGHGTQAPPILPHANEPPTTSAPGAREQAQAQAPQPRRNDPLAPRTIQTAHGLITFIPVPFNFPFPAPGNGVGVGVQAGGNAATVNSQVPPAFGLGQGQPPNGNANVNTQGYPPGLGFPHFHVQLPHMPEFGAQRGVPAPAPAPANNANANLNQAIPTSPFVSAQEAAAITHTEEHLMQHLRSQGLTSDDAENIRRSTLAGRQADRLRRGENPVEVDLEDEDEDDMMDIDEGMGMVVDLTMNQGGIDGLETGADPAAMMTQDELDRQDFDHVINFFSHAARQAQGQAQAGTQAQGQAQQPERGTQGGTTSAQNASQAHQPSQQQQPQQQQGQGFVPPNFGNFGPEDDMTINEFVTRMFANLGGPQQQQAPHGPQAQRQNDQPPSQAQAQAQPQAGQEPAEPNPANDNNNNGGRPRQQQAQFGFSNFTFGPFTNFGSIFGQVPMFNPNGTANANSGGGATGQERVKKAWTLPPAPGPTLRQRIERRERDAGLRCYDISCGVGPSDEDPVVSDETVATGLRQLMIMSKNHGVDGMPGVCMHTFHPGCLVSAERVALGGADVNVIEGGDVEVSCPVCRSAGCVTKQEWEEGILALA